jgi:Uma2 family endonuclease
MVRLGVEAKELIHQGINLNTGADRTTTFSSPKRYLWDNQPQHVDWEFLTLKGEINKARLVHIKGISEQLSSDGSISADSSGGINKVYSRKALMTFAFLEVLAQAKMQINSYVYRHKWGDESKPRRIGRLIVTCPTAMSRLEQIALRKCAEDASIILDLPPQNSIKRRTNAMIALSDPPYLTPEAYLQLEEQSLVKHEYIDGQAYAMAGTTDTHNTLAGNLYTLIRSHLRGSDCRVYIADIKARLEKRNRFYYPDLLITCDRQDQETPTYKRYAKLIIEVLSDSTEAFDRGDKFNDYQTLDSLVEYVLINSNHQRDIIGANKNVSGILD